jgi:hypothetical protein
MRDARMENRIVTSLSQSKSDEQNRMMSDLSQSKSDEEIDFMIRLFPGDAHGRPGACLLCSQLAEKECNLLFAA